MAKIIPVASLDAGELKRVQEPATYKRSQYLRKEFGAEEKELLQVGFLTRIRVTRWHLWRPLRPRYPARSRDSLSLPTYRTGPF
jgi:hypothetical protein